MRVIELAHPDAAQAKVAPRVYLDDPADVVVRQLTTERLLRLCSPVSPKD